VAISEHPVQEEAGLPAHHMRLLDGEVVETLPQTTAALLPPCGDESLWKITQRLVVNTFLVLYA